MHAGAVSTHHAADVAQFKRGEIMTHEHIREIYDRNPNMTLKELSQKTGLSINKLKTILRGRQ
jgi:hypothetical protein